MDEEELLSSLEESLDYNNGGFVSTFTLPVVADDGNVGSASTDEPPQRTNTSATSSSLSPPLLPLHPLSQSQCSDKSPTQLSPASSIFRSPSSQAQLMVSSPPAAGSSHTMLSSSSNHDNNFLLAPPPDLLSPRSIASDGTDLVGNNNNSESLSPETTNTHISSNSLDTNASTPPRSGNTFADDAAQAGENGRTAKYTSRSGGGISRLDEHISESPGKPSNKPSTLNKPKHLSSTSSKRKKTKPSSRKNNLVILPWTAPFRHSKSDNSATASHNNGYYTPMAAASQKSPLPPPHPLSHVQSYPPTSAHHPHYVHSSHRYPQHMHSHSFASDASSSEATPVTCPANVRRDRICSIDESLGPDDNNRIDNEMHNEQGGSRQFILETNECVDPFQDFDDTLSKDSATNQDLISIGVNIQMKIEGSVQENNKVAIIDSFPHSPSTNSLLGLDIPFHNNNPHPENHVKKSSLEYSPATLVTFADAEGKIISPMPFLPDETAAIQQLPPPPTSDIQYCTNETDDGSTLSNPPCSVLDDTPPSSPNRYAQQSPQKWHHRHQSSLVSCSESCLQSQCSITSYESQSMFDYPNPDPQFLSEAGVSPLDSSYSFEEDRSLCADEKAFVQQIHNSGLSSLSFEHVEDTLDNTSMDVEMELVYNAGSFDNGSVGGGSVGSAGSVMSIEERKEIERRIYCYKKFREKRSKMSKHVQVSNGVSKFDDGQNTTTNHATPSRGAPATPLASNKAFQQLQIPDSDVIDQFNRECEDSFESLEMAPLAKSTDPFNNQESSIHNDRSAHLDFRETKLHPSHNAGWRPYYYIRNLIWWWQLHPSSLSNPQCSRRNSNQQLLYRYSYTGFDDVDFDRNTSSCPYCCYPGNNLNRYHPHGTFWYMQTGWSKLTFIACFFLMIGWVFSGDGLKKHKTQNNLSQESYYKHVHRTKHGYHLYDRDDPLSKESLLPTKRTVDDADDFVNPMSRPEDDDVDFSVVQRYFPTESQSIAGMDDDVFRKFEMEDDLFDVFDKTTIGDASNLKEAADAVITGFDGEDGPAVDIDTIVVLGERHVGLDWLVQKLEVLYPDLSVSSGFPSENRISGEWFQPEDDGINVTVSKHILVVSLFINPYDWVELMHADPIGAPFHVGMDWKTFVEAEWSPRDQQSHESPSSNNPNKTSAKDPTEKLLIDSIPDDDDDDDDDDAGWDDIVPDKNPSDKNSKRRLKLNDNTASNSHYEFKMGGSTYYRSILELRADKIRSAVKGSLYRPGVFVVVPVRYEDLLQPYTQRSSSSSLNESNLSLPGIIGLVNQIQAIAKISPDAELDKSFFPKPIGCNGHICHPSINKMRQNAEYVSYLNERCDWHSEQLMGYQKITSQPKPSVEQIVILGERHSQAEWLVDRLARCFPDIAVTYGFGRPGKFFQSPVATNHSTLVISMFINPYDWVEQMRLKPINAPAHKNMKWTDFLESPWERTRSPLDSSVLDTSKERCSFNFTYHEIIPCHTQRDPDSDDFPVYELQHPSSGFDATSDNAYSSILELRADKIQNHLSAAHFPGVVHLIKLRYEDLVWDSASYSDEDTYLTLPFPGIAGLLETIRDHTTLAPDVTAGWILDETGYFKAEPLRVGIELDEDYVQAMEKGIDWDVEALIGYGP